MATEYLWHGKRYWTHHPVGEQLMGWNTQFEPCAVIKKTPKRIHINSPTHGSMQLNRAALERDGKVYHSKVHEYFHKERPAVDPEKPTQAYYDFLARFHGTPNALRVLGLSPGCSHNDIKRAYKRLAKTRHPDAGGSQQAFIELQQAYKQALASRKG